MRILFTTYSSSFKFKGGGHIIMERIAEHLNKIKGIKVEIIEPEKADFSKYDLVHYFDVMKESLVFMKEIKKNKIPLAIHPFFTYSFDAALKEKMPFFQRIKMIIYNLVNKYDLFGKSYVRWEMELADVLFPNSEMEKEIMVKDFKLSPKKICIVPDGIDKRFFKAKPTAFVKKFGLKNFVLFVGRLEPRKNIVKLISACESLGLTLVLIGPEDKQSPEYYKECLSIAGKNTHFLGPLPHSSKMLESAFAACKVFALPSWDETPGLAALEAAATGANIVITSGGCTKDYFNGFVLYVDPNNFEEIKGHIKTAFFSKKSDGLKNFVQKNYNWERIAMQILQEYEKL